MGSIRQSHPIGKATRQAAAGSGAQGHGGAASPKVLRQYISRFPQASVLVIGDLILDHYIWGRVSRISPEAPVPVVHVDSESLKLGGAANVFNNILALGGKRTSAASSVRMKAAGCSSKSWDRHVLGVEGS